MNRAERRNLPPSRATQQAQATRRRIVIFSTLGVIAIGIVIALVLANNRGQQNASQAPINAQLTVNELAPEFSVSTTHGPFDLAQARGKPTLLEVFATWCPHCQRETANLNRLYATYGNRVHFVAVSGSPLDMAAQGAESQADVIAFATRFGVRYPIAFDPNLSVAKAYLQSGFPTFVLIGPHGKIQSFTSGETAQNALAAALKASLAGRAPDPQMNAPG